MIIPFQKSNFPGKNEYQFTTALGTQYQVLFGRKAKDIFHYTVIFGVQNEEFEDNEGNLLNKKTYLDMKKQGLIG